MRAPERKPPAGEEPGRERPDSSDVLLGELVHEIAVLARREVELAAVRHGPQVRQMVIELSAALTAGAALLLACAALSWAAVQGLALAIPSWSASLAVAAGWAVVAALLLRLDHPRRLLRRLTQETSTRAVVSAELVRTQAEEAVKATAERLGRALASEAVEREIRSGVVAGERMVESAENEAEDLLKELIVALLAPGRAGISLLERMVGRPESR
jgi:hypothetical protein